MPNSCLTTIGGGAFQRCNRLTSISFPPTLKIIEGYAFSCCVGLRCVEIPSSLEQIGDGAFAYLESKRVLFASDSKLERIGRRAFRGSYLETISIPASVERIGREAFAECIYLTSVVIPADSKLEDVDPEVFRDCPNLRIMKSPIRKTKTKSSCSIS